MEKNTEITLNETNYKYYHLHTNNINNPTNAENDNNKPLNT